jgi:ribosome-interacting GTPase 1
MTPSYRDAPLTSAGEIMPANLTPQYSAAEEEYKKAKTSDEKLACLKKMFLELPKHKGTEKIQATLKTKMSEMREEIDKQKSTPAKTSILAKIPRQGAGQIVLVGAPNAGKSSLLARVTKASPAVAPYPFTTREPYPGMMEAEQVKIQLIDLPPITKDHLESWQANLIRNADAALFLIDLGDDDGLTATQEVLDRLHEAKIKLIFSATTQLDPEFDWVCCLVVGNKIDQPDWEVRKELYGDLLGPVAPWCCISCASGAGLEEFKKQAFDLLQVIRVYSKQPGKPAEKKEPFTVPNGSTVLDLAEAIHRDLAKNVKHARVWGTGVLDGQTVSRDHELHDGDVVEIHE